MLSWLPLSGCCGNLVLIGKIGSHPLVPQPWPGKPKGFLRTFRIAAVGAFWIRRPIRSCKLQIYTNSVHGQQNLYMEKWRRRTGRVSEVVVGGDLKALTPWISITPQTTFLNIRSNKALRSSIVLGDRGSDNTKDPIAVAKSGALVSKKKPAEPSERT